MPRYIDADALYQKIDAWREKLVLTYGEVDDYVEGVRDVLDIIKDAPTEDVVKVVRCRECEFYCRGVCMYPRWLIGGVEPGDHCSWGNRGTPDGKTD